MISNESEIETIPTLDNEAPILEKAEVNGNKLVLMYSENDALDKTDIPESSAFIVTANGNVIGIDSVAIDSKYNTVTLVLSKQVVYQQDVTVTYKDETTNDDTIALQDMSGNDAASVINKSVTNNTPDRIGPVFAGAIAKDDAILVNFTDDSELDSLTKIQPGLFIVKSDHKKITVDDVLVSDHSVTLKLDTPIQYNEKVILEYKDKTNSNDAGVVQDIYGNDAGSVKSQEVKNTTIDKDAPTLEKAEVNGNKLVLMYSENDALDHTNIPEISAFKVAASGKIIGVDNVSVNSKNNSVTLTLSKPVLYQEDVTITYKDVAKSNDRFAIQDMSGNDASGFLAEKVINITVDKQGPEYSSSTINSDKLVITYSEKDILDTVNIPDVSEFTVKADGKTIGVKALEITQNTITLDLDKQIAYGQTVTFSYRDPSKMNDKYAVQDNSGNDAQSLSNIKVKNITPDTTEPKLNKATVDGALVNISYTDNSGLDTKNIPLADSFQVSSGGVTLTINKVQVSSDTVSLKLDTLVGFKEEVSVSYKDPTINNDANALQDTSGNDAPSFDLPKVGNLTKDTKPPEFVNAEVLSNKLILHYQDDDGIDTTKGPVVEDFTVKVDGKRVTIAEVSMEKKLQAAVLTLEKPVTYNDVVTVAYSDPSRKNDTNAIQDKSGNDATTMIATQVLNKTTDYILGVTASPVEESDKETQILSLTLTLDKKPTVPVTVKFETLTSGTATPDVDFKETKGEVVFPVGQNSATVTIPVAVNTDPSEPDETVDVKFYGADINSPITATGTILTNREALNMNYTFTTSVQDNLQGSDGNDTFFAEITNSVQSTATNTLSAGDRADGGKGADRIVITATDALSYPGKISETFNPMAEVIGFQLDNIEEMELRAYDADGVPDTPGDVVLNFVNVHGVKKLLSTTSTANIRLDNVQEKFSDIEITGNGFMGTELTVKYASTVESATQNILLKGFGEEGKDQNGHINIDKVATFNIATEGSKRSIIKLDSNQLKTLNLDLSSDLIILNPELDSTVTKIAGKKTMKGALSIDLSGFKDEKNISVTSGAGSDSIQTRGGNDKLEVYGGNNTVISGSGSDTVVSGDGNDSIDVGFGDNLVKAGSGNNFIHAESGNDTIKSGAGSDTIEAGNSTDKIVDGKIVKKGFNSIDTGDGNDLVIVSDGNDKITLGGGDDIVELGTNLNIDDSIDGGDGSNTLKAESVESVSDQGDFDNVAKFQELQFTGQTGGVLSGVTTGLNRVGITTYTFLQGINVDTRLYDVEVPKESMLTVNLFSGTSSGEGLTVSALNQVEKLNVNVTNDGFSDEQIRVIQADNVSALNLDFNDTKKDDPKVYYPADDSLKIDSLKGSGLTQINLSGNSNISVTNPIVSGTLESIVSTVKSGDISLSVNSSKIKTITTLGGNDFLESYGLKQTIDSGSGSDTIYSGDGVDSINSGDGSDWIESGMGNDTVNSGTGNDSIDAGEGDDSIIGGAGDDTITAGVGVDFLNGGDGDDVFNFTYSTLADKQGLTSADTIIGGSGNDKVVILKESAGDVTLVDDIFFNWKDVETLDISNAVDTPNDADNLAGSATLNSIALARSIKNVVTGRFNDYIAVGEGFNSGLSVELRGGDDRLDATTAPKGSTVTVNIVPAFDDNGLAISNITESDTLLGGAGTNDTINITASGVRSVTNAKDFEKITILDGTDLDRDKIGDYSVNLTTKDQVINSGGTLYVDATALRDPKGRSTFTFDGTDESNGRFSIVSGTNSDTITGGTGADTIDGGAGNNLMDGGQGNDSLIAGVGNDTVYGNSGDDTILAGGGFDSIEGGLGTDSIDGGDQGDTITGGKGKDILTGGTGSDVFIYTKEDIGGDNVDKIMDFVSGTDKIVFTGVAGSDRNTMTTKIVFKGNFDSFGAAQGAILEGVTGGTGVSKANDGTIEAVLEKDTNTLWFNLNEDGALNADDLQIILSGVTNLSQTDFAVN